MRIDLYTKTILAVIAILLTTIVLKPIGWPAIVLAQSPLSGVQFASGPDGLEFLDTKTGDVWVYTPVQGASKPEFVAVHMGRLTRLGQPMVPPK